LGVGRWLLEYSRSSTVYHLLMDRYTDGAVSVSAR
jgi:hypothetical protein